MARIGLEQTPAKMNMRQRPADLSIEQPKADMSITTTKGKLTIDQSQAWEDLNLMNTIRLNQKFAQEGVKAAQEGTSRRAEQGAELVKIETGANVIAEQAIQNGHPPMKQLSIKYIPSHFSVKFSYEPAKVNIDVKANKPNIQVQINKPELDFERGGVNIYMEQYPELKIDFVDVYA